MKGISLAPCAAPFHAKELNQHAQLDAYSMLKMNTTTDDVDYKVIRSKLAPIREDGQLYCGAALANGPGTVSIHALLDENSEAQRILTAALNLQWTVDPIGKGHKPRIELGPYLWAQGDLALARARVPRLLFDPSLYKQPEAGILQRNYAVMALSHFKCIVWTHPRYLWQPEGCYFKQMHVAMAKLAKGPDHDMSEEEMPEGLTKVELDMEPGNFLLIYGHVPIAFDVADGKEDILARIIPVSSDTSAAWPKTHKQLFQDKGAIGHHSANHIGWSFQANVAAPEGEVEVPTFHIRPLKSDRPGVGLQGIRCYGTLQRLSETAGGLFAEELKPFELSKSIALSNFKNIMEAHTEDAVALAKKVVASYAKEELSDKNQRNTLKLLQLALKKDPEADSYVDTIKKALTMARKHNLLPKGAGGSKRSKSRKSSSSSTQSKRKKTAQAMVDKYMRTTDSATDRKTVLEALIKVKTEPTAENMDILRSLTKNEYSLLYMEEARFTRGNDNTPFSSATAAREYAKEIDADGVEKNYFKIQSKAGEEWTDLPWDSK